MKKQNFNVLNLHRMSQTSHSKGNMLKSRMAKIMAVLLLGTVFFSQSCTKKDEQKSPEGTTLQSNKNTSDGINTSAVALPGGKANYVTVVMGGANKARFVRISQYTFTAGTGTTGTVSSQFKYWDQIFTGNAMTNKVATGYTTGNCINDNCTIKTPIGFQPGQAWSTISGTYYIGGGQVRITWAGGQYEAWTIATAKSYGVIPLTIANTNYDVHHGYGFGSNASFNTGATIAQIKAGGNLIGERWENIYNAPDTYSASLSWDNGSYTTCVPGTSMQGSETGGLCTNARWHRYVAGNPSTDKRKNYYNHQLGSVTCADPAGNTNPCISAQAGHTAAMLQVLDDSGNFKGWVTAEASLHAYVNGQAVVNIGYFVK